MPVIECEECSQPAVVRAIVQKLPLTLATTIDVRNLCYECARDAGFTLGKRSDYDHTGGKS